MNRPTQSAHPDRVISRAANTPRRFPRRRPAGRADETDSDRAGGKARNRLKTTVNGHKIGWAPAQACREPSPPGQHGVARLNRRDLDRRLRRRPKTKRSVDTTGMSTGTSANGILHVLLVEDDRDNAHLIEEMLTAEASAEDAIVRFELETRSRLSEGVKRVSQGGVEAILLDLTLPDSQGLRSLSAMREQAPHVPIVVLTGAADKKLGVQALGAGAQDYLVKGRTDSGLLVRSLRYAIDRMRLERILEQYVLIDELSGVYNRRAFFKAAEQQLRLLRRFRKQALLVLVDIDGLKQINDTFGHAAGDVAIIDAVGLLRKTFRESDIIGRMAGDDFAVLAFEVGQDDLTTIPRRLTKSLAAYNKTPDRRARLAFSLGFAVIKPDSGSSLDHLLKEAEEDIDLKKHGRPRVSGKPPLKLELS